MPTPIQISRQNHQSLIGQTATVLQTVNNFSLIQTEQGKLILRIHPESSQLQQKSQVQIVPIKNSQTDRGVIEYYLTVKA